MQPKRIEQLFAEKSRLEREYEHLKKQIEPIKDNVHDPELLRLYGVYYRYERTIRENAQEIKDFEVSQCKGI